MANIKTKPDVMELGNQKSRVWKSQALSTGDVLFTGMLEVWGVLIQDASKWAAGGWTVGTGATRGQVTFNLSAPTTGRIMVFGR
jgi:hypothetical protein